MRGRRYPRCIECNLPVACGQGARHLSCSPTCKACYGRIPTSGHKCIKSKSEAS